MARTPRDRLEAALLGRHLEGASLHRSVQSALGVGLAGGARALDTLVRYRGSALAELFRSLAALKALQAERSLPALLDAKTEQTLSCGSVAWRGGADPCTGSAREVGDRNEPRDPEPVSQRDPAPLLF